MKLRSILLPTDFSDCASYALSYAASLARDAGAAIICLHVVESVMPTVGYTGIAEPLPVSDISDQLEDSASRELPKIADSEERSEEHTSELQSQSNLVCRLLLEKKKKNNI